MRLLHPTRGVRLIIRHQTSGVQTMARHEVPRPTTRNTSTPLPHGVREQLRRLKGDIAHVILGQQTIASSYQPQSDAAYSFPSHTLKFTSNMEEMARYYFDSEGKLLRPKICFLMASACNQKMASSGMGDKQSDAVPRKGIEDIELNQYRIAMVSEMIHTASLIHDDVIDESGLRRGTPTANARWGNRQAVLVGDFILARATKVLCSVGDPTVIATMSSILEDLVAGELMQFNSPDDIGPVERFKHYMLRIHYKTASLFANSCLSVAMLAGCSKAAREEAYEFGRALGLAFQLIDDVLDYLGTTEKTGKPSHQDLRQGLATCPIIFAAEEYPALRAAISRRFCEPEDIIMASELVRCSRGIERTKELAKKHCNTAIQLAQQLPNGQMVRDCLIDIINTQLERET